VDLLDMPAKEGVSNRNASVEDMFQKARKLKPEPFFSDAETRRIRLGNFDDHLDRLAEADWVIEVIVERLDIKRKLMERVEKHARPDAIISSNTSGLSIADIAEERSKGFRQRFLGTHFFNPPRYLKLLEVIPGPDTDSSVVERVSEFARLRLGKGVVVAKDTPCFIGNRIGVYVMMHAARAAVEGGYTIEEIDAMTGKLLGRPKSATFRTADVVGLDTLILVADHLHETLGDEMYKVPDAIRKMVDKKLLGAKTGGGFYKKVGKDILSINFKTLEYEPAKPMDLKSIDKYEETSGLKNRLEAAYNDKRRVGEFVRPHLQETMGYSVHCLREIADSPADIDNAMKWGFGWKMGPFEIWDTLGFEKIVSDLRHSHTGLPEWVGSMRVDGANGWHKAESGGGVSIYIPERAGYAEQKKREDEISIPALARASRKPLYENAEVSLLDMGDGVALFEFHSKGNTLGAKVMKGLQDSLDFIEGGGDWRGMVIGNEGENFSFGANLGEVAMKVVGEKLTAGLATGLLGSVDDMIAEFQNILQRVHYFSKPVVVAAHQMALGGGCEMIMASPHPVAASESYIGLVELGVGLIPAGCGTMRMVKWAHRNAASEEPADVQAWLAKAFKQIATAEVATSARKAQQAGFLPLDTPIVMQAERRFHVAKTEVLRLSEEGYAPPSRDPILVLGAPAKATFRVAANNLKAGRFATEYDAFLAGKLAHIMVGGDLTGPTLVDEQYLLDLERETFLSLLGEKKTQDRVKHILTKKKPLRN
jgi:3-hydroxyacyl-CoA dehydrogenase